MSNPKKKYHRGVQDVERTLETLSDQQKKERRIAWLRENSKRKVSKEVVDEVDIKNKLNVDFNDKGEQV